MDQTRSFRSNSKDQRTNLSTKGSNLPPNKSQTNIPCPDFDISKLTADLFLKTAADIANKIADNNNGMKKSQVRRFYSEVKKMERNVLVEDDKAFKEKYWPLISMLKAKMAYQKGRGKEVNISPVFADFINKGIDKIQESKEKFLTFCKLFEAVVGYVSEKLD